MSCKISGFLNFHVSHLNYEKFKLCLQNTLNTLKMTRVYFGVLHDTSYIEDRLTLDPFGMLKGLASQTLRILNLILISFIKF